MNKTLVFRSNEELLEWLVSPYTQDELDDLVCEECGYSDGCATKCPLRDGEDSD